MKGLYGHVLAQNATITAEKGSLVTVQFNFEGEGALNPDWTP